mmetsp:Transcript_26522/g.45398  ORF Transcript_26522/g.45398 Transcript_26522/m.45398 type:complete len:279 (+) Transcript_26522:9-845(+)
MKHTSLLFVSLCFVLCVSGWTWKEMVAEQYLYYSYATYCNVDKVSAWDCKWCQESSVSSFVPTAFPYDQKISGYGFVGYHPINQTIVVSFRGTDDLENWIIDLESAILTPYKNMTGVEVGEGFYKEWNDLSTQVLPAVYNLTTQFPSYQIWVTGHSLGAAISILCAAELASEGYEVNVYNYGLPRVGNEAFSDYYRSIVPNTYRVVNGHDVVPHVPLYAMGFYHVPTEVWENPAESLSFRICDGSGEDPNCSDSQTLDLSVYDHLHYLGIEESCVDDD